MTQEHLKEIFETKYDMKERVIYLMITNNPNGGRTLEAMGKIGDQEFESHLNSIDMTGAEQEFSLDFNIKGLIQSIASAMYCAEHHTYCNKAFDSKANVPIKGIETYYQLIWVK